MVSQLRTMAFVGIEARPVDVQVHVASGLPAFTIVGLADKAVAESKERVRAALGAVGLALPPRRITVNLAPADLPKEGSHFDLPIALALLMALDVIAPEETERFVALGELGLDGALRPVPGVLPAAVGANAEDRGLICPAEQGPEAAWAGDIPVLAANHLMALLNHFKGRQMLSQPVATLAPQPIYQRDLKDIKGQEAAKRALEIAAAGGHTLLMCGPPGAGKSLLAAALPGILPDLTPGEALEASMISSVAGTLTDGMISQTRPFRTPHHSASMAALTGGGLKVKPGEVSLAHCGVLFLDELPEFQRNALDALRQPLETGEVSVARANAHVTFPAKFQLIAAMNPCRCGHLADPEAACTRAPKCGLDYQSKISGPMLDRIDLHVDVPPVSAADLTLPPPAEGSTEVAARVRAARDIQMTRYKDDSITTNSEADGPVLENASALDEAGQNLMQTAIAQLKLTARGYHRVLRVARTLADLAGEENVTRVHLAEALSYRRIRPAA
ncbi:MAG: YifB family Mg chelatase-like AAA ATPase [Pseudomonadota bacterium]